MQTLSPEFTGISDDVFTGESNFTVFHCTSMIQRRDLDGNLSSATIGIRVLWEVEISSFVGTHDSKKMSVSKNLTHTHNVHLEYVVGFKFARENFKRFLRNQLKQSIIGDSYRVTLLMEMGLLHDDFGNFFM